MSFYHHLQRTIPDFEAKYLSTLRNLDLSNSFVVLLIENYDLQNHKLFQYQLLVKVLSILTNRLPQTYQILNVLLH